MVKHRLETSLDLYSGATNFYIQLIQIWNKISCSTRDINQTYKPALRWTTTEIVHHLLVVHVFYYPD